jgi:hypothetical protein
MILLAHATRRMEQITRMQELAANKLEWDKSKFVDTWNLKEDDDQTLIPFAARMDTWIEKYWDGGRVESWDGERMNTHGAEVDAAIYTVPLSWHRWRGL